MFFAAVPAWGLVLVEDGRARASIVVANDALPQVKFAASELQDHVLKISGAKLAIADQPQAGMIPIYVGPSSAAKAAGVKFDDLSGEAFRIVATEKYLALGGHDESFLRYPRGHDSMHVRDKLLEQWQQQTGHPWDLPWRNLYDPRNHSSKLGFSVYDPTGTLFAVYEFLEMQGVRWYMPYGELGTIIPQSASVHIDVQNVTKKPVFSHRYLWYSFANGDHEGFLWFKRQKLGMSQMSWYGHGVPYVTKYQKETHPEFFSVMDGKLHNTGDGPGHPRLGPPLRDEMIRFADRVFTIFPEMRYCPIAPSDGYIRIDDRDAAAGWLKKARGEQGKLSDYAWKFMNEVAQGVYEQHPDRIVMGLAYSSYQKMPGNIKAFSPNLGVGYCQARARYVDPERRRENSANRDAWIDAISSGEFFIWEYYLFDRKGDNLRGVPVIFTKVQQEEARQLRGRSKGEYIECSWSHNNRMANPATNHLTYYIQGKLYWDPDLDLEALINEYCRLFYGPAARQMKAYYAFAEEVWMRPGNRDPYAEDAFITPEDVDRYFKLLHAAKAAAGQGVHGRRIDLIIEECAPLKLIFPYQDAMAQGKAMAEAGDVVSSVKAYERAIASAHHARHKARAMFELGNVYRDRAGDEDKALAQYLDAFRQPIGRRRALQWGAMMAAFDILRKQQRHREAIELLDRFPQSASSDYWVFMTLKGRGLIAHDQGQAAQADAYFDQAMALPAAPQRLKDNLAAQRKQLDKKQ